MLSWWVGAGRSMQLCRLWFPQYSRSKSGLTHGFCIRWLLISRCARMMWTRYFSDKKFGFDDSLDVTKCLQRIEILDLLHMCAPCSELPSDISTMIYDDFKKYVTHIRRIRFWFIFWIFLDFGITLIIIFCGEGP